MGVSTKIDKHVKSKTKKIPTPSKINSSNIDSQSDIKGRCPFCNSLKIASKGLRRGKRRYVCIDCRKNWTSTEKYKTQGLLDKKQKKDKFSPEIPIETIRKYLKDRYLNSQPIKFYYRDDVRPREIYNYRLDDIYVHVRSEQGYFIKFRIDKIRKI